MCCHPCHTVQKLSLQYILCRLCRGHHANFSHLFTHSIAPYRYVSVSLNNFSHLQCARSKTAHRIHTHIELVWVHQINFHAFRLHSQQCHTNTHCSPHNCSWENFSFFLLCLPVYMRVCVCLCVHVSPSVCVRFCSVCFFIVSNNRSFCWFVLPNLKRCIV